MKTSNIFKTVLTATMITVAGAGVSLAQEETKVETTQNTSLDRIVFKELLKQLDAHELKIINNRVNYKKGWFSTTLAEAYEEGVENFNKIFNESSLKDDNMKRMIMVLIFDYNLSIADLDIEGKALRRFEQIQNMKTKE